MRVNYLVFLSVLLCVNVAFSAPSVKVHRKQGSHVIAPRDKTGIVMAPTALTVAENERGFGLDATFQYYIGKLYESVRVDGLGISKSTWLSPLRLGIFGFDVKYVVWSEKGVLPAFGLGYNGFLPVDASMSFSVSDQTKEDLKGKYIDNFYGVFTKKLSWGHATVGYMHSVFADTLGLPRIIASLSDDITSWGDQVFFAGLSHQLSSGRMLKVEMLMDLNADKYVINEKRADELKRKTNPILINTYWGNLIGFNLSFLKTNNDFSALGYFSFRLPLFPFVGG